MSRATLLRCAYKLGDVVRRGDDMGLIVKNDGRFYTAQMVTATGSITDTTTNIEIRHYLKLVKLDTVYSRDSRPMLRNLTLEQELLDADDDRKHSLINGYVDRLSETQKK